MGEPGFPRAPWWAVLVGLVVAGAVLVLVPVVVPTAGAQGIWALSFLVMTIVALVLVITSGARGLSSLTAVLKSLTIILPRKRQSTSEDGEE